MERSIPGDEWGGRPARPLRREALAQRRERAGREAHRGDRVPAAGEEHDATAVEEAARDVVALRPRRARSSAMSANVSRTQGKRAEGRITQSLALQSTSAR